MSLLIDLVKDLDWYGMVEAPRKNLES